MANDFKEFRRSQAPSWLAGPYGEAWSKAMGDGEDSLVALIKAAVKSRFISLTPPGGVEEIAKERGLRRGPAEGLPSFRERLRLAWDSWVFAGTAKGILTQLFAAGYRDVFVEQNRRQFTIDDNGNFLVTHLPAGSWFTGYPIFWNKFDVVFMPPNWGGSTPAESSDEAQLIKGIIQDWKSGHSLCANIRIVEEGTVWGMPGLTWGDGTKWGDTVQVVWTP